MVAKAIRGWMSAVGTLLGGGAAIFGVLNFGELARQIPTSSKETVVQVSAPRLAPPSGTAEPDKRVTVRFDQLEILGHCDNSAFESRGEFFYSFAVDGGEFAAVTRENYSSLRVGERLQIGAETSFVRSSEPGEKVVLSGHVWDADDTFNLGDDLAGSLRVELSSIDNWSEGSHAVTLSDGHPGCAVQLTYTVSVEPAV